MHNIQKEDLIGRPPYNVDLVLNNANLFSHIKNTSLGPRSLRHEEAADYFKILDSTYYRRFPNMS